MDISTSSLQRQNPSTQAQSALCKEQLLSIDNKLDATFLTAKTVDAFLTYSQERHLYKINKKISKQIIKAYKSAKRRAPTWFEARNLHYALVGQAFSKGINDVDAALLELAKKADDKPPTE